jgi:hypothetical protein
MIRAVGSHVLAGVVLVAVAAGGFAGVTVGAVRGHGDYTLAAAYDAGIITRADLAGFGCVPAVFGGITCQPTDTPWCSEHPPPNPDLLGRVMFDGRLAKRLEAEECSVSPYDLGIISGFRSVGPVHLPRPYLR